jgi:hypothetical protein
MDERFDFKSFEETLAQKGYLVFIREPAGLKNRCDLVAFGSDATGKATLSVFEFKVGANVNLDLEAAKLDAMRSETGADQCFLVSDDLIYRLSSDGFSLERILEIPEIEKNGQLVTDDRIGFQLINQRISGHKLGEQIASISKLLAELKFEDGLVIWDRPSIKMNGKTFRDAMIDIYRKRASKLSGHNFASRDVQYMIQNLLRAFTDVTDVFDPFFGLGFSSFSVAETMMSRSGGSAFKIRGIEINRQAVAEAEYLGQTFPKSVSIEIEVGDSLECQWPKTSLLVSELPLGVKLQKPFAIEDVTCTSIEELALLRAASSVRNGEISHGAILITSRGWLSKSSSKRLRDKLAEMRVVKGLIGLPPLHMPFTSIPLLLVILQRDSLEATTGELGSDWKSHISGEKGNLYEIL